MTDANRLKWEIIETISEYFKEHLSDEADDLERQFMKEYDSRLEKLEGESFEIRHLISEFGPSLSAVLQPGEHLQRLMGLVSPILNEALSRVERQQIQSSLKEQESARVASSPKLQVIPMYGKAERLELVSVGIDIGSSTSHLVFSRLRLHRERSFQNPSNRFHVQERELLYESDIIFTPLLDRYTIDVEEIVKFCRGEYQKAGFTPEMVDTGAVIVTGETAKKKNAAEIVNRLSSESGRFVSATAGPNLESLLSAMGSGVVDSSRDQNCTILNVDIGGGTSNLAIVANGQVFSTSCINVGGRLLGIDKDFRIWRIDEPTRFVMKQLGMDYELGNTISEEDVRAIAREYAKALVEVMTGPASSPIAKELMMTEGLNFSINVDEYSFSGGVAEIYYARSTSSYDDIGRYLADELCILVGELGFKVIEPPNKIRATVIGAGAFSLSVSGSTCYFDRRIIFPISNIPVVPVNVTAENYKPGIVEKEIKRAYTIFDMEEGKDVVALYFRDPLYRSYSWLQEFVKAIEAALTATIANRRMVILLFASDIGQMVGLMVRRETSIQHNLICLDELFLETGDWIDIGAPLSSGQVFPITVKSLVFNANKEYS